MSDATFLSGPHTHSGATISRTMGLVMLALLPATLFAFYAFGWPAVFLFLATTLAAVFAEWMALALSGKEARPTLMDGSALLTGWLIALCLPPHAPWWIGVTGSFTAIFLAKHAFGGLGQNIFNPAMIARTVLLISFPLEMTTFIAPQPMGSAGAPTFLQGLRITFGGAPVDAVSSASLLGSIKTELGQGLTLADIGAQAFDLRQMVVGLEPGSMGETSALLVVLGGLILLMTRVISWHTPVAMIAATAVLAFVFNLMDPDRFAGPAVHLLSGTFLFAAFFIVTDYVTAPASNAGKLIFGAGVGLLTWLIRSFAAYPEGVGFAVLLMNACVPIIDTYVRPRIYGRTRKGAPISYEGK